VAMAEVVSNPVIWLVVESTTVKKSPCLPLVDANDSYIGGQSPVAIHHARWNPAEVVRGLQSRFESWCSNVWRNLSLPL